MTSSRKSCQAEGDEECSNEAWGLCFHCSRNLCLDHVTEHAQLIDALNRLPLNDYSKLLVDLFSRLQSLTISKNVLDEPFRKLEQWRVDAYRQIDEITGRKIQEIRTKIDEYRQIFDTMRNEQLEKITRYKQKIADLYRKSQITNKDIANLRASIDRIQNDVHSFDKHAVEVTGQSPITSSVHIRMQVNNWKPSSDLSSASSSSSSTSSIIRQLEFRLKYVSLSGTVTCQYILAPVNGTVGDLIEQFIVTQDRTTMSNRTRDYFLATEVNQDRVRQRFTSDTQLKSIFNKIDELTLYETPFELNASNLQKYCLILCAFQDGLPWEMKFGLPILLKVPRFQCRGSDLINELDKTLEKCFSFVVDEQNRVRYQVRIVSDDRQTGTTTMLNEWIDAVIDDHLLMANNATLIVNLATDGRTSMKEQSTHLARLDGILKNTERRRKSRK